MRACMCRRGSSNKVLIHLSLHAKSSTWLCHQARGCPSNIYYAGIPKGFQVPTWTPLISRRTEIFGVFSFFLSNDACVRADAAISVVAHWHYVENDNQICFKLGGLFCQRRRISCAFIESIPFSVQGCLAGQILLTALISATSVDLVYCICLNN